MANIFGQRDYRGRVFLLQLSLASVCVARPTAKEDRGGRRLRISMLPGSRPLPTIVLPALA